MSSPALRKRRDHLMTMADGDVVDLGGPGGLAALAAQPSGSLDAVISILTLCAVHDVAATLAGVRRVLKPGGRFLFLEHVPDWPGARRSTDLLGPTWRWMGGCDPGRDIPSEVRRSGLVLGDLDRFSVPTLAVPLRNCVAGVAIEPPVEVPA